MERVEPENADSNMATKVWSVTELRATSIGRRRRNETTCVVWSIRDRMRTHAQRQTGTEVAVPATWVKARPAAFRLVDLERGGMAQKERAAR